MAKRKRKMPDRLTSAPRNPLFNHPLMNKSHAHDKTNKAKRRASKIAFNRDWYCQNSLNYQQAILTIPVFA